MTRPSGVPSRPQDAGLAVVEVAIASTALITLLCLVIFAGRVSELAADVQTASAAAARAASLQGSLAGADQAAQQTASANLDDAGVSCGTLEVTTAGNLQPGGTVTVTITCIADMSSLAPLAPAGLTRSFVASSSEVVDTFRGTGKLALSAGSAGSSSRVEGP